jgi:hypothetical protein
MTIMKMPMTVISMRVTMARVSVSAPVIIVTMLCVWMVGHFGDQMGVVGTRLPVMRVAMTSLLHSHISKTSEVKGSDITYWLGSMRMWMWMALRATNGVSIDRSIHVWTTTYMVMMSADSKHAKEIHTEPQWADNQQLPEIPHFGWVNSACPSVCEGNRIVPSEHAHPLNGLEQDEDRDENQEDSICEPGDRLNAPVAE